MPHASVARLILAGVLPALLLAGCQRVIFDSAPVEPACDPGLRGGWQIVEEVDDAEDESADGQAADDTPRTPDRLRVRIDAQCRLTGSWTEEGELRELPATTLLTTRLGERSLLWIEHAWANRAFEIDEVALDGKPGYYVYRYRLRKGRWELRPFDVQRLAGKVLADHWRGDIHKQGQTLVVRVTEDSEHTERLLRRATLQVERDARIVFTADAGEVERE